MTHKKLCWVCDKCNRLVVSDSKEHHKMDFCSCGGCGVDLEEYHCRMAGNPRIIATLEESKWVTKSDEIKETKSEIKIKNCKGVKIRKGNENGKC